MSLKVLNKLDKVSFLLDNKSSSFKIFVLKLKWFANSRAEFMGFGILEKNRLKSSFNSWVRVSNKDGFLRVLFISSREQIFTSLQMIISFLSFKFNNINLNNR